MVVPEQRDLLLHRPRRVDHPVNPPTLHRLGLVEREISFEPIEHLVERIGIDVIFQRDVDRPRRRCLQHHLEPIGRHAEPRATKKMPHPSLVPKLLRNGLKDSNGSEGG